MALPSWVYNQTSLPPWMRAPAPPPNPRPAPPPPQGMPGVVTGIGNYPGIPRTNYFPTSSGPQTPEVLYGTPPPSTMQPGNGNNTNPGMVGMLPPGHPGSNVPAPTFQEPTFENYPGAPPQYVDPQFENSPPIQNPSTSGLDAQYAQLMGQLQGRMNQPGVQFNPFTPKEQVYSQSPELTNAIQMIRELAETGGYSESDKSNIRARGVSPIRSVYANAMQNLDRSKALQGGYSPGYTAATSKLTRELADRIAGQTTNVNADLAEKVAQGKMQMAPQLGNITGHVNDLINQISGQNVDTANQAGMFNTTGKFNADVTNRSNENQIMGMIQQLFGTGADISGRNADRAVNVAGLNQQGVNDRNQNALARASGRNQFNLSTREMDQRGVDSRNQNALSASNARNQFNMQGAELSQQMRQFLQRMGLDTAELNQRGALAGQGNELDWARLNQQGGLGLIQALMEMMQQQGRA